MRDLTEDELYRVAYAIGGLRRHLEGMTANGGPLVLPSELEMARDAVAEVRRILAGDWYDIGDLVQAVIPDRDPPIK